MAQAVERPKAELERWPIRIRQLQLLHRTQVTPRMLRLTLGGPGHTGFESHIADEHVKLFFPDSPDDLSGIPVAEGDQLKWPRPAAPNRDYTVRRYDPVVGEVDIDVVLHEGGVGSAWARDAEIGSSIWVAGPPRGIRIPDTFTWQAYLADETGLPALARRLAELPEDMHGIAIIEVADQAEVQGLCAPAGMQIRWVVRGSNDVPTAMLVKAARRVAIPTGGGAYVWFGGEQSAIRPLRAWIKEAGLEKGEFDLTGYWRRGARGNQLSAKDLAHALAHMLHLPH